MAQMANISALCTQYLDLVRPVYWQSLKIQIELYGKFPVRSSKLWLFFTRKEYVTEVFESQMVFTTIINHWNVDFTPANVALRVSGLDGLSEEQLIDALGKPDITQVKIENTEEVHNLSTAPQYLVHPVNFTKLGADLVTDQACVIDFGESFKTSEPPDDLGTPQPYRSPELVLDRKAGVASDLWALACTLFEIRTGRKLFGTFDDDPDDLLYVMALLLGKLPEPWWSEWEARKDCFEDEADTQGRVVKSANTDESIPSDLPWIVQDPRSFEETLAPGLYYLDADGEPLAHRDISKEERDVFSDLLSKMLKYRPEERPSTSEILEHPWFKM